MRSSTLLCLVSPAAALALVPHQVSRNLAAFLIILAMLASYNFSIAQPARFINICLVLESKEIGNKEEGTRCQRKENDSAFDVL